MPATATLEHPRDTFWSADTEPSLGVPRDIELYSKPAVRRAESLRAYSEELRKLYSAELHEIALPYLLVTSGSTLELIRNQQSFDIQALKTDAPVAKEAFLSWLLNRDAWGDKSQQLQAEIKNLLNLTRGWDGDDADPIDPVSADRACAFVDSLGARGREFEAFPDPNGRVGLEAHRNNDAAYLLFHRDGSIAYVFKKQGAIHRGDKATPDAVKEVMNALF